MFKRMFFLLAVFCLPLLAAAQQPEPAVYSSVVLWTIPRAQWDEYVTLTEKNARPIFERRLTDGTLLSWGIFTTIVHTEDGYTHGAWYSAKSIAALERVREELIKLPPNPAVLAATRHRDLALRLPLRRARAATGSGYLSVSFVQVKPGKGREWRELWDKYTKPIYDELLANGTITYYDLEQQAIHIDPPGLHYSVTIAPNAEALDKIEAAFEAAFQKRSQEEREKVGAAFREATEAGAHRDYAARIVSYAQK